MLDLDTLGTLQGRGPWALGSLGPSASRCGCFITTFWRRSCALGISILSLSRGTPSGVPWVGLQCASGLRSSWLRKVAPNSENRRNTLVRTVEGRQVGDWREKLQVKRERKGSHFENDEDGELPAEQGAGGIYSITPIYAWSGR